MVLELFGEEFKAQLLSELVELNKLAFEEAKRQRSRETKWVSIAEVQEATGWGRKRVELFRDQGKFRWQQLTKGGKYQYDLNDVLRFQNQMAK